MNRLYELRKNINLSQKELAEKIGAKQNTYSKWEHSANSISVKNLLKLCSFFDVSPGYLLGINDIKKPASDAECEKLKNATSLQKFVINLILELRSDLVHDIKGYITALTNQIDDITKNF